MPDADDNRLPAVIARGQTPGGPWAGFCVIRSAPGCREYMRLLLLFRDGLVVGVGEDRYGQFAARGCYDPMTGELTFDGNTPLYEALGRCRVTLNNGIWGLWRWPAEGTGPEIMPLAGVRAGAVRGRDERGVTAALSIVWATVDGFIRPTRGYSGGVLSVNGE